MPLVSFIVSITVATVSACSNENMAAAGSSGQGSYSEQGNTMASGQSSCAESAQSCNSKQSNMMASGQCGTCMGKGTYAGGTYAGESNAKTTSQSSYSASGKSSYSESAQSSYNESAKSSYAASGQGSYSGQSDMTTYLWIQSISHYFNGKNCMQYRVL